MKAYYITYDDGCMTIRHAVVLAIDPGSALKKFRKETKVSPRDVRTIERLATTYVIGREA